MVNGIRLQKPSPKNFTKSVTGLPAASPPKKTMTAASKAKTNASGNHRSDQSDMAEPQRAKGVDERPAAAAVFCSEGFVWGITKWDIVTHPAAREKRFDGLR